MSQALPHSVGLIPATAPGPRCWIRSRKLYCLSFCLAFPFLTFTEQALIGHTLVIGAQIQAREISLSPSGTPLALEAGSF